MLTRLISRGCLLVAVLSAAIVTGLAQGRFEIVTGKSFTAAVPRDFYVEGKAIPVEKLNAVLVETPGGARVLFALIATAGFASGIQQKYSGMLISEGHVSICGKDVAVGSYGFGIRRTRTSRSRQARFFLYNQGGHAVKECGMEKDSRIREPKPLQIVIESPRSARFYLGRDWVKLGP